MLLHNWQNQNWAKHGGGRQFKCKLMYDDSIICATLATPSSWILIDQAPFIILVGPTENPKSTIGVGILGNRTLQHCTPPARTKIHIHCPTELQNLTVKKIKINYKITNTEKLNYSKYHLIFHIYANPQDHRISEQNGPPIFSTNNLFVRPIMVHTITQWNKSYPSPLTSQCVIGLKYLHVIVFDS